MKTIKELMNRNPTLLAAGQQLGSIWIICIINDRFHEGIYSGSTVSVLVLS